MAYLLIVSANSDIAKACARVYAKAGYNLYLASRQVEETRLLAASLTEQYHVDVESFHLDINKTENHSKFLQNLFNREKLKWPDALLLCTGLLGSQGEAQARPEHAAKILDTNFRNPVLFIEQFVEALLINKKQTPGQLSTDNFIVALSSVAGDRGRQSNYFYGASKAGLSTYLAGLRNRLQPLGIKVLTVKPGYVRTRMTEGLDLPPALTTEPDILAHSIFRAQQKGRDLLYVKPIWRYIMLVLRFLPEALFKRLKL